mmetsp:Transcript_8793/g.18943  ORF Transcript_8793/g.18943 Transcript_8793/m.18943 type:complete len:226 (-) Transcript_8793:63-740(-)
MDRLTRRTPYSANGIHLLRRLGLTFVAFRAARSIDDGDLSQVAGRPGLHEGDRGGETEPIDATTRRDVVEGVEDEGEGLDVGDVEFGIVADVAVVGGVLRLVIAVVIVIVIAPLAVIFHRRRDHPQRRLARHHTLGHADVMTPKQELSIQIAHIDGIQIDDFDVAKAAQGEVFEELASDAAGSDEEDATIEDGGEEGGAEGGMDPAEDGGAGFGHVCRRGVVPAA